MLNSVINKTNIVEGIVSPEKTIFLPSMWNEVTKSQLNAAIGGVERSLGLAIIELKDEISESKLELRGEFQTEIADAETRLSANIAGVDSELQTVASDVQNVKAILTGNNQFVKITSSKAYTSRVTADGANIFDDQLTPVLEIQGSTVSVENQGLKHAYINSIVSIGKNFLDTSKYIVEGSGYIGFDVSNLIIGETYTFSCNTDKSDIGEIEFFKINRSFNGTNNEGVFVYPISNRKCTFTMANAYPNEKVYLFLAKDWQGNKDLDWIKKWDLQIELGVKATEYKPYKQSIFQLPETVMLPEYNRILPQNGDLIVQTKIIEFDGSNDEVWQVLGGEYPYFYINLDDYKGIPNTGISNRFVQNPNISSTNNTEFGYAILNSWDGYFRLIIKPDDSDIDSSKLDDWKESLKENPFVLAYKLINSKTLKINNCPKLYSADDKGSETIVQGETDNSQFGAMPTVTQTYFGKVGEE